MGADSTRKPVLDKPEKPYPDFPLTAHPRGYWCKKILGHVHYFGPWDDPMGALEKYKAQRDDLYAGRKPRPVGEEVFTVQDAVNVYLTAAKQRQERGELKGRTFGDYDATCGLIVGQFTKFRAVDDLRPEDFGAFAADLAKRNGPVALGNVIQRVRSVFKFAFDNGYIDRPVRFGTEFKKPSRRVLRQARANNGQRFLEAHECRALLDAASIPMRAMILLGLNCGLGNTDVSELNRAHLALDAGILDFPRPKTGIERRATLWPETAAALRKAIVWGAATLTTGYGRGLPRYRPADPADADAVFITRKQRRYVRLGEDKRTDTVGLDFGKLLRAVKVKGADGKEVSLKRLGVNFYTLRHVFESIAGETGDQVAVDRIMGHVDESMGERYREWRKDGREDERLRKVTEHVRQWLKPWEVAALKPAAEKAAAGGAA